MDLTRICRRNRDGAYGTQANRLRGLSAAAKDLQELGYKLPYARSLKPKHITALTTHWSEKGLSQATMKNRMGWLRWWAEKVDKKSVIERDNETYGIKDDDKKETNRAQRLDGEKLAKVECEFVQTTLKLQAVFGLRREEAIKFRPHMADKGDRIVLTASWTKGGRYREIPIEHPKQRAVLDEAKKIAGKNALIPTDRTYVQHLKTYEYQTLKAGLTNTHGLRHAWAQWRYLTLTGKRCPLAGGTRRKDMTAAEREADRRVRLQISEELGHARIIITDIYLGKGR